LHNILHKLLKKNYNKKKNNIKMKNLIFCIFLVFCFVPLGFADLYQGDISYPGNGLVATQQWANGSPGPDASLSWTVDDTTNSDFWTYTYRFQVDEKSISHIIIELSDDVTVSDFQDGTTLGYDGIQAYNGTGGSNPGIPGIIYGIKWNTDDLCSGGFINTCVPIPDSNEWELYDLTVTIVIDKVPTWGDYYSVDGKTKDLEVYAYNEMFGHDTTDDPIADANNGGWVLVPDTMTGDNGNGGGGTSTTTIPEPGTILILGSGLISLAFYRRIKFRK
jgi:hypothetical protein